MEVLHVTRVTAASSGTYTSTVMQRAARPSAYTGAPNNGMCGYRRGALGVADGVPGDTGGISVTILPVSIFGGDPARSFLRTVLG